MQANSQFHPNIGPFGPSAHRQFGKIEALSVYFRPVLMHIGQIETVHYFGISVESFCGQIVSEQTTFPQKITGSHLAAVHSDIRKNYYAGVDIRRFQ
jgi:hypothetical protein